MLALLAAALLQPAEIQDIKPLTPYYKKGYWLPVLVRLKSREGGTFDLEAHTDSKVTFVLPVTMAADATIQVSIPVIFATSFGSLRLAIGSHEKTFPGPLTCVESRDLVVLSHSPLSLAPGITDLAGRSMYVSLYKPGEEAFVEPAGEGIDAILVERLPPGRFPIWTGGGGQFLVPESKRTREILNRGGFSMFDRRPYELARDLPAPKLKTNAAYLFVALYFLSIAAAGAVFHRRGLPALLGVAVAFTLGFLLFFPHTLVAQYEHGLLVDSAAVRLSIVDVPRDETVTLKFAGLTKPLADVPMKLQVSDPTVARDVHLIRGAPICFISWVESEGLPTAEFNSGRVRNASDKNWDDVMVFHDTGMSYFGAIHAAQEDAARQGEFSIFGLQIAARFAQRGPHVFGQIVAPEQVVRRGEPGYTLEVHRMPTHFIVRIR